MNAIVVAVGGRISSWTLSRWGAAAGYGRGGFAVALLAAVLGSACAPHQSRLEAQLCESRPSEAPLRPTITSVSFPQAGVLTVAGIQLQTHLGATQARITCKSSGCSEQWEVVTAAGFPVSATEMSFVLPASIKAGAYEISVSNGCTSASRYFYLGAVGGQVVGCTTEPMPGGVLIKCGEQTFPLAINTDGTLGAGCSMTETAAGVEVRCGTQVSTLRHAQNCTVSKSGSEVTLTCPGGTPVTFQESTQVAPPALPTNWTYCLAAGEPQNNIVEMRCPDPANPQSGSVTNYRLKLLNQPDPQAATGTVDGVQYRTLAATALSFADTRTQCRDAGYRMCRVEEMDVLGARLQTDVYYWVNGGLCIVPNTTRVGRWVVEKAVTSIATGAFELRATCVDKGTTTMGYADSLHGICCWTAEEG